MKVIFLIFLMLTGFFNFAQDKTVYSLLEKGNLELLEKKIEELRLEKSIKSTAYQGALIAKKASKLKKPKQKLNVFKEGVRLLEESIKKEESNLEYLFLRYIIQVKSPKFLSYNENIVEDKKRIEEGRISKTLKKLIVDFNLKNESFKLAIN